MTDISILHESKHIEWSIKNFFDKPDEVDYFLDSACFFLSDTEWFLRMWTNGDSEHNTEGYVGLFLVMKGDFALEQDVFLRLGIINKDEMEMKVVENQHAFSKTASGSGDANFYARSELLRYKEDLVPNGILTVFCTFRIVVNGQLSSSATVESAYDNFFPGTSIMIQDFQDMYTSGHLSDLTIVVQNKEFRTHRFILATRSSVFKTMLSHDMVEKNSGRVEIPDGDPDTFEDFLLYLYTGKLDNMSSRTAASLYRAADKYDVKNLKEECLRCMADELSDDVFCEVLLFAIAQNERYLRKHVEEYFTSNAKNIVETEKWRTFLVQHPFAANELFYQHLISIDNI